MVQPLHHFLIPTMLACADSCGALRARAGLQVRAMHSLDASASRGRAPRKHMSRATTSQAVLSRWLYSSSTLLAAGSRLAPCSVMQPRLSAKLCATATAPGCASTASSRWEGPVVVTASVVRYPGVLAARAMHAEDCVGALPVHVMPRASAADR